MKDKPNSTRIYDAEGFRLRAAAVCVRNEEMKEVLLVSSSRHRDKWVVPGGGVEPNEQSDLAALREVWEEAGVRGRLGRCLGVFENEERKHRTAVYVLVVTEESPEWEDSLNMGRRRKWFDVEDAVRALDSNKPVQSHYIRLMLKEKETDS